MRGNTNSNYKEIETSNINGKSMLINFINNLTSLLNKIATIKSFELNPAKKGKSTQ